MSDELKPCPLTDEQIHHLVERFLRWRLPEDFSPDDGISFNPTYNGATGPVKREPTGTNLLTHQQALHMVRYMVSGLPQNDPESRITELERELAALRAPGELTDERIAALWTKLDASSYHSTVNDIVALVRRCVAIDRASRPAPKWVKKNSEECARLESEGWRYVRHDLIGRDEDGYKIEWWFLCPPIPPPEEGK